MTTTQRTIERPRVEPTPAPERGRNRLVLPAFGMIVALLFGVLAGYALFGSDDSSSTDPVVAGGGDLTPRQEQMVELIRDNADAWRAGDGDAVVAHYAEAGRAELLGTTIRADDGSLARYVENVSLSGLDVLEPMLVSEDTIVFFHTGVGRGVLTDIMEFTRTGEVLITSHEITS